MALSLSRHGDRRGMAEDANRGRGMIVSRQPAPCRFSAIRSFNLFRVWPVPDLLEDSVTGKMTLSISRRAEPRAGVLHVSLLHSSCIIFLLPVRAASTGLIGGDRGDRRTDWPY